MCFSQSSEANIHKKVEKKKLKALKNVKESTNLQKWLRIA